jgi:hypothetical protein
MEEIKGHWHQVVGDSLCIYSTIDVYDYQVLINKHCINGNKIESKLIKVGSNLIIEPNMLFISGEVNVLNDTLIITHLEIPEYKTVWVKKQGDWKDIENDLSSNLQVRITLPIISNPLSIDSLRLKPYAVVNIGSLKECFVFSNMQYDTLSIELNSKLSKFKDINSYFENERGAWGDTLVDLVIILNIDKYTPQHYIDKIIENTVSLNFVERVYRTCVDTSNNKIGVYVVWPNASPLPRD